MIETTKLLTIKDMPVKTDIRQDLLDAFLASRDETIFAEI
jgi:hypothetical protein